MYYDVAAIALFSMLIAWVSFKAISIRNSIDDLSSNCDALKWDLDTAERNLSAAGKLIQQLSDEMAANQADAAAGRLVRAKFLGSLARPESVSVFHKEIEEAIAMDRDLGAPLLVATQ